MNTFKEYQAYAEAAGIDVVDLHEGQDTPTTPAPFEASEIAIPEDEMSAKGQGKLAILLHGFNPFNNNPFTQDEANRGIYRDYQKFFDSIKRQLPGYAVTVAAYDTHRSFAETGANLSQMFQGWSNRFDLSKTIIVGYSLGGLVARQMVAKGLPFAKLYTTCTPHFGVLPYLYAAPVVPYFLTASHGAQSMNPFSNDLARLNAHDSHLRNKYYCHGINYTDVRGFHNDDTITDCNQATMTGSQLGGRWATHIGLLTSMICEPHLRGYTDAEEWGSGRWAAAEFVSRISGV